MEERENQKPKEINKFLNKLLLNMAKPNNNCIDEYEKCIDKRPWFIFKYFWNEYCQKKFVVCEQNKKRHIHPGFLKK